MSRWPVAGVALTMLLVLTEARGASFPPHAVTIAALDSLWQANARQELWDRLDREIAAARAVGDSLYLVELLARTGSSHVAIGEALQGRDALDEGLACARRLHHGHLERTCLRWRAVASLQTGERERAAVEFQSLLDLARTAGDSLHQGWALTGLAYDDWTNGRASAARDHYGAAVVLFHGVKDARAELFALNGLGTTLQDLGAYSDALACYRRSAELAHDRGWPATEAPALNNMGCLLLDLGDPGEAHRRFQRAYELQCADSNLPEAVIVATNLAQCELQLGLPGEAIARLDSLRTVCLDRGLRDKAMELSNELAYALRADGRPRQAAGLHRATLAQADRLDVRDELGAVVGLARALAEADSNGAALRLLQERSAWAGRLEDPLLRVQFDLELGLRLLHAGQAGSSLEILTRAGASASRLGREDLLLPSLISAADAERLLQRPDRALALYQRAIECWESERALPADPQWRETRGVLAHDLFGGLGSLMLAFPSGPSAEERTVLAFDAVQRYKARTMIERMLGPDGMDAPARSAAPITCRMLQQGVLRPGEMLLDYYLGTDRSFCFVVTREECRAFPLLPGPELAERLDRFVKLVAAPDSAPADLVRVTQAVRSVLLGPIEDQLSGVRTLTISPDGEINRIPFALLLAAPEESRGASPAPITVQQVPSASILARLRASGPGAGPGAEPPASILVLSGSRTENGAVLPGVRAETGYILRTCAHATVGAPAAPDSGGAAAALGGFDVLHFAAHTIGDEEHPWRSRIVLDRRTGSDSVPDLVAGDIARARVAARLVVLSGCRTAGNRVLPGEGLQGLAAAFLAAGARTVVATLWPVNDRSAYLLTRELYSGLRRGCTVSTALVRAQAALRRRPQTAHPVHWAGFVVVGDGDLPVHITRRWFVPRPAWSVLLALGGAVLLFGPRLVSRNGRRGL